VQRPYLTQPDPDGARFLDRLTFDKGNITALEGMLGAGSTRA
jgi:hypothetical protein